jgi:hypothetical protein
MIEQDIIKILNTKILTLELMVNEIYETLVDKKLIDEDEFNTSINQKVAKINKLLGNETFEMEFESDDDELIHYSTLFGGPIGEA